MRKAAQEERELLLGGGEESIVRMRYLQTKAGMTSAAESITESFRRTSQLMVQEVERSGSTVMAFDEKRWTAGHSSLDLSRNRSDRRFNHSSEPFSRYYQGQRWPRDLRNDGPPGIDPVTKPAVSSYAPRYGGLVVMTILPLPIVQEVTILYLRSPSFERSLSDRGRRSSFVHEASKYGSYATSMDSPANRLPSQQNYGSASSGKGDNGRLNEYAPDSSSHRKDKRDQHHHHSRR